MYLYIIKGYDTIFPFSDIILAKYKIRFHITGIGNFQLIHNNINY